jgi:hypothetical protein
MPKLRQAHSPTRAATFATRGSLISAKRKRREATGAEAMSKKGGGLQGSEERRII